MQIQRKSYSEIDRTYFFTATIHQWLPLLSSKENKELIINYLKELSARGLIKVYSFVIMPNHVHFIWQQLQKNGKETAQGSFLKYTAHEFLKTLKQIGTSKLYEVSAANKKHEIWQRDSLSIEISSRDFAKQKIDYIHFNPVSGKWNLAKDYLDYYYSSARFYETGMDEFGFLNNRPKASGMGVAQQVRTLAPTVGELCLGRMYIGRGSLETTTYWVAFLAVNTISNDIETIEAISCSPRMDNLYPGYSNNDVTIRISYDKFRFRIFHILNRNLIPRFISCKQKCPI